MPRKERPCQICGGPRGQSGVGCYCLPCRVVCTRISDPVGNAWPGRLPPKERDKRERRLLAIARRVALEDTADG